MTVATGGLSLKGTAATYAGKAVVSIGTQGIINIERDNEGNLGTDINLVKVIGDTFFNPVSGSILGNSSSINIGINRSNSASIKLGKDVIVGMGIDLLSIGRSSIYEKNSAGKLWEAIIEIQSQIITQGISKGTEK